VNQPQNGFKLCLRDPAVYPCELVRFGRVDVLHVRLGFQIIGEVDWYCIGSRLVANVAG